MGDALVIVAPDMRNGGSVGAVAWRHAVELSRTFQVYVITRAVPSGAHPGIQPIVVQPATWNGLRRFCHVPNELSFLWVVRRALNAAMKSAALAPAVAAPPR